MSKLLLVLEDEKSWQTMIKATIKKALPETELFLTDNGLSCMNQLEKMTVLPSICILDINIPGDLNGLDVLEKIRSDSRYRDMPVVMFTTYEHEIDRTRAETLGATDYVTKPEGSAGMRKKLTQMIEKYTVKETEHPEFPDLSEYF